MPVLGVLICQGLVNVGVIRAEDKVLRFVCMCVSHQTSHPACLADARLPHKIHIMHTNRDDPSIPDPSVQWHRRCRTHVCLSHSSVHHHVRPNDQRDCVHSQNAVLVSL